LPSSVPSEGRSSIGAGRTERYNMNRKIFKHTLQYYKCDNMENKTNLYMKEYFKRPEARAKLLERMRKYNQRPEVKAKNQARNKEYFSRPDVKARIKLRRQKYFKRPEISEKMKEYYKQKNKENRLECLSIYSNNNLECKCCGEKNLKFLTLDHTDNNGADERRKLSRGGSSFFLYLKINNFPNKESYQVLCMNCNWGKRMNHGVCPHKDQIS